MKVIIAGGRDFVLNNQAKEFLLKRVHLFTEIVQGGARGIDLSAKLFAQDNGIECKEFIADWHRHGKAAGPIRNTKMAKYADACILFEGGIGTQSMYKEAKKQNLFIMDLRYIEV